MSPITTARYGQVPPLVIAAAVCTPTPDASSSDPESRWYALVAQEPRLHTLSLAVRRMRVDYDHPRYWPRYARWKRWLTALVGWDANNPALRSSRQYETAHDHLMRVYEGGQP